MCVWPDSGQTSQPSAETHDLLDHVWGWSQFGGALLAAVALVIALISSRDSKRSADALSPNARAIFARPLRSIADAY